ncbi:MAG TPA: hypothetical protein VF062_28610 [Candidatus Limnocylindrales bacterium]
MPSLKDLLEVTFMGPGLVCILVVLVAGVLSLVKRLRSRRAAAMERLTNEATKLFMDGQLADAKAKAEQAVELADERRHPAATARAHFCMGRVLARLGELPEAEAHLADAVRLDADPHRKALAAAYLSMVLTRLQRPGEALQRAGEAVAIHDKLKEYPEPVMRAGAGWAYVAQALALAGNDKDGLPAADKARSIFDDLEIADGLAHAYYAKAVALRGKDNESAFAAASEAHSRYTRLHAANPGLYGDRLAESRKLLDELGDAAW